MKNLLKEPYWLSRFLASDPGRKRLNQAGKATLSLIFSVFTVLIIINWADGPELTPAIMGGIAGMMGILVVSDDTTKQKKVTTLLLSLSAIGGVTFGSLLAYNAYLVSALMIAIIFSAFYFSKYGSRFFSLGMIAFMTVYFASFLKLPSEQFLWFYMAIFIGVTYAYLNNFILFKGSAQLLRRSMNSFHRQANLTFKLLMKMLEDPSTSDRYNKRLLYNVKKLREYAGHVSADLNVHDIKELWPGLTASQVKLYVFDTAMFVATLADSLTQLKENEGLEATDVRRRLAKVVSSLQKADVLAVDYDEENLREAQMAIGELRSIINDLFTQYKGDPQGWHYLLRRIESTANHVTRAALSIQQVKNEEPLTPSDDKKDDQEEESSTDQADKKKGLEPTTKKAYQALVAGSISIVVGYAISPVQPYWVVLTSFIVLLGTQSVGRIYLKGLQRSIGTIIGAVIGFFLANLVSGNSQLEVFLLFAVVFFAFYLLTVSYTMMSLFITMLIAFMYDLMLGGISFSLLTARVVDTIAGAGIALIVSSFLFPTQTRDKVYETFSEYLEELDIYMTQYIRSFTEEINIKELADQAFTLDEKLQAVLDEAEPIMQHPATRRHSELPRWVTIFTAINYYADHLVASSYLKNIGYPEQVRQTFPTLENHISHNITTIKKILDGDQTGGTLYTLQEERELIERGAPLEEQHYIDLVHHVYYIWRVNQSLLLLGEKLGASQTEKSL
ncbi:FUSC family protein [Halobacillus sp. A1]|uniref:FUSC family protein n=1 Tax=Halobacillus sp. A1 TaxID=2880262 RepID=UPI0020A68274|nr:FUSC family protein [Halobacillus sp. A1]MCP3031687.1 FUSC family protein [Halobacillus sp. A1]